MIKHIAQYFKTSLSALTLIPVFTGQAFADSNGTMGYHGEGYGWSMGMGWGHSLFGSLMMLLFFGGLVFVIVLIVRQLGERSTNEPTPDSGRAALDILNDRFARGEIEKDEYLERKRILSE